MASIRQNAYPDVLPDFRNLGVIARILIGVNLALFAAELYSSAELAAASEGFARVAALSSPVLFSSLVLLYVAGPSLRRIPYPLGAMAIVATVALLAAGAWSAWPAEARRSDQGALPFVLLAAFIAAVLLAYLRLLSRAYSPALAEARLQALQARIRPHFLFNSLNAVLSLIRRDPRRAETALEDLAELFRPLMSDAREFVPLSDEISLLERYADLEQLRLGERLRVSWDVEGAPADAMLPPLILQPLLENAVYHGVEPGTEPGEVAISIARRGDRVRIRLENPWRPEQQQRAGNRMALDNVRERLQLFFDAEATLDTRVEGTRYRVELDLPYRPKGAAQP